MAASVAGSLEHLASLYRQRKQFETALPLLERALVIREKCCGRLNHITITTVERLADLYESVNRRSDAETLYLREAAETEQVSGPLSSDLADSLDQLGEFYEKGGELQKARRMLERAVAIREHKDDGKLDDNLERLGDIEEKLGNQSSAESLRAKAEIVRNKEVEGISGQSADSMLLDVAATESEMNGDVTYAFQIVQQALDSAQRVYSTESVQAASLIEKLGDLYESVKDYRRAGTQYQAALVIRRKLANSDNPEILRDILRLSRLSSMSRLSQGTDAKDPDGKEALFKELVRTYTASFGESSLEVAALLHDQAEDDLRGGMYKAAEPLAKRAWRIREDVGGPADRLTEESRRLLAQVYVKISQSTESIAMLTAAISTIQSAFGPDAPELGVVFRDRGDLYKELNKASAAESSYSQALRVFNLDNTKRGMQERLITLKQKGDYAGEEQYYRQELLSDRRHALFGLGMVNQHQQRYARALEYYRLWEDLIPSQQEFYGVTDMELDLVMSDASDRGAWDVMKWVFTTRGKLDESKLTKNLMVGSEDIRRAYIASTNDNIDHAISMLLAIPNDRDAIRIAAESVLRTKGRLLEVIGRELSILRSHPNVENSRVLAEIQSVRATLAALAFIKPEDAQTEIWNRLWKRERQLEEQVAALQAPERAPSSPLDIEAAARAGVKVNRELVEAVHIEAVQSKLKSNEVLIEIVRYARVAWNQTKGKYRKSPRYAAFVFGRTGSVSWHDLGDAEGLDRLALALRSSLERRAALDIRQSSLELGKLLWKPIEPLLRGAERILIAPDGALNFVPFAALQTQAGGFLLDRYTITYLTSGRDLLTKYVSQGRGTTLIFAPGSYDTPIKTPVIPGARPIDTLEPFQALSGASGEADALAELFPDARVLRDTDATEHALKAANQPYLLHIATHGFFLKDLPRPVPDSLRLQTSSGDFGGPQGGITTVLGPLLRSGLAFAGANQRASDGEDGILTALEAASLDLRGTQQVVLSACRSGVGEVQNGDGVYGLRRAFLVAGAATIVMSLWKVNDDATREFMVNYYTRLRGGEARSDALTAVQRDMARPGYHYSSPSYWAAFVLAGRTGPLEGQSAQSNR